VERSDYAYPFYYFGSPAASVSSCAFELDALLGGKSRRLGGSGSSILGVNVENRSIEVSHFKWIWYRIQVICIYGANVDDQLIQAVRS
jgi:hypothetical protein